MKEDLIEIGYIRKAHGIRGEVVLRLYDGDFSFLNKGEVLRLGVQDFVILDFKPHKEDLILSLKEVNTRNESEALKAKKVYIISSLIEKSENEDEVYLRKMLGFQVYLGLEKKGKVAGLAVTEAHDLIRVSLDTGGEVELPWVDDFIESVDLELEKIVFRCPEDLFDAGFFSGEQK